MMIWALPDHISPFVAISFYGCVLIFPTPRRGHYFLWGRLMITCTQAFFAPRTGLYQGVVGFGTIYLQPMIKRVRNGEKRS